MYEIIIGDELSSNEDIQEFYFQFKSLMTFYECALLEVETKFKVLDKEFSNIFDRNPIESIKTRIKSHTSIIEKLERKGLAINISNIENNLKDVAGIRIICSFIDDVYNLVNTFCKQDDIRILQIKDYIKYPKKNGYRSLHMIVEVPIFLQNEKKYIKVEVQLRTIAMDSWASLEHHLYYKKGIEDDNEINDELYLCSVLSNELDQKMNKLKRKLY